MIVSTCWRSSSPQPKGHRSDQKIPKATAKAMARIIGVLYDPNARHSRVSKVVVDTPATAFFVFSVAKSSSWDAFDDQPQSCWGGIRATQVMTWELT